MCYIHLSPIPYFIRHLNRHKDRYALFRSVTQINRDSRRIVENSFPRFPLCGVRRMGRTDPGYAWVCPSIDVFHLPTLRDQSLDWDPVQPRDYINDVDGRLYRFNEMLAMREVYLNPKPAAAALLQHVRIIRINGIKRMLHYYCPEEIRCIESLPALELIQASCGAYGDGDARRFPPLPENSEDRHRHGKLIPIDESMYPHAAMAAERDPSGLDHFWGKLLKRGVRFELTGDSDLEEEDIITRNELVQTPEGLMIRFTDQVCRCYLDPVETERKRMMEEMGFGSQWYVSLPRDMSSNDYIRCR